MPMWIYDSAAVRKKIQQMWMYDSAAVRKKIQQMWIYDSAGNRKLIFQGTTGPDISWTFSGPNTSGTGDGGVGPLYSIAPYPVAPRGSLAFIAGEYSGSVIGAHFQKDSITGGNNGLWLTMNVAGPDPKIIGKKVRLNGSIPTIGGNPASGMVYIGAGFGGYYYVSGGFDNLFPISNTSYTLGLVNT